MFTRNGRVRKGRERYYTEWLQNSKQRRISTWRNDQRFRREIATKLFRHETMFNFYMNSFDTIIENYADFFIIKKKDITFKNVK